MVLASARMALQVRSEPGLGKHGHATTVGTFLVKANLRDCRQFAFVLGGIVSALTCKCGF